MFAVGAFMVRTRRVELRILRLSAVRINLLCYIRKNGDERGIRTRIFQGLSLLPLPVRLFHHKTRLYIYRNRTEIIWLAVKFFNH